MDLQAGKPVHGKDLIGREKEIRELIYLLKGGQSIVLIAPRRFGKTSLIMEVMNRMKKEGIFICYVDIFSTPDIRLFAERLIENLLGNKKMATVFRRFKTNMVELLKNFQLKHEFDGAEFILGFAQKDKDPFELLGESIDFIEHFGKRNNKKVVCGLDEFGDISKLDGQEIIKMLRSKIQLQKSTSYIFSGSYEAVMSKLFISRKSPFYRFARIYNLGFIDLHEFSKYIKNRLKKFKIDPADDYVDGILKTTKGHPYYTQLFIQEIIVQQYLSEKEELPEVSEIVSRVLNIEKNYLEKSWEEISSKREEKIILMEIASGTKKLFGSSLTHQINVSRALSALRGKGILLKNNSKYFFSDPLLEIWIQNNVL